MNGLVRGIVLLWLAVMAGASWAQTFRQDAATVLVNEYPVFTLKATLDNLKPEARAGRIVETLRESRVPIAPPLKIVQGERGIWVKAGELGIVRITPEEAKLNNVKADDLALQWRNRLEYALGLPAIAVANGTINVAAEAEVVGRLFGFEALQANFTVDDPAICSVEKVIGGAKIRGLKAGTTEVKIITPNGTSRWVVRVRESLIPANTPISTRVFGNPCSAEIVSANVTSAIRQQLKLPEGSTLEVLFVDARPVPSGITTKIRARIRIRSQGLTPYEGPIEVEVINAGSGRAREQALWYSNNPEQVTKMGGLFQATLGPNRPVRLLYHHQNGMPTPVAARVLVFNPGTTTAQLMLIRGDGAPDEDPVRTGLDAGDRFIRAWLSPSADFISIPPQTYMPISVRMLRQKQVISGLAYLSLMGGGSHSVVIRTDAVLTEFLDPTWKEAAESDAPWNFASPIAFERMPSDVESSQHLYEQPFKDIETSYAVGGRFAFVRIGQNPIEAQQGNGKLDGNFGVLYSVKATITNPTKVASQVEVTFEASAGYSGGLFVIDGAVQKSPVLQEKEELRLKMVRLGPGESRTMNILTMPLSGSSYPATLAIRPVDSARSQ